MNSEGNTLQVSKTLSLSAIVDSNFFDKDVFGSLLMSNVLRPGMVFFLRIDSDYLKNEFEKYDLFSFLGITPPISIL
jgi:hypothetical protein